MDNTFRINIEYSIILVNTLRMFNIYIAPMLTMTLRYYHINRGARVVDIIGEKTKGKEKKRNEIKERKFW